MILVTTPDGLTHYLDSVDEIAAHSSPNTRAALQAAFDAGDWETYSPPEPETEPAPPDWSEFRLALMVSASFREWSRKLPADWREDLKMSALAANLEALQGVYNHLANIYPPEEEAVEEWQQLANDSHIPLVF